MQATVFILDLEISKVNALALSWTVVHPITESSPLFGFTQEDLEESKAEIVVFIKAFDDVFANTVMARTSYIASEIIWGARFKLMYNPNTTHTQTILGLQKINDYEKIDLPATAVVKQPQFE